MRDNINSHVWLLINCCCVGVIVVDAVGVNWASKIIAIKNCLT